MYVHNSRSGFGLGADAIPPPATDTNTKTYSIVFAVIIGASILAGLSMLVPKPR